MRWREALAPVPMSRVAIVARAQGLRAALVRVADAGTVEFDRVVPVADQPVSEASRALQRVGQGGAVRPRLAAAAADVDAMEAAGRADLLAGEVELDDKAAQAIVRDGVAALIGWTPTATLPELSARLATVGAAAAPLARPKGIEPPTAGAPGRTRRAFAPLVDTYGTVAYVDVDPTILAGLSYTVMFGAMFGDVGHGALLVIASLLIRFGRWTALAKLRPHWMFVAAAGLSATLFGFAYGECFGPTGLVPQGVLVPMEEPVTMLIAGVALGAVLLAGAYAVGTVNRLREDGWSVALYAPGGVAGALVFVGVGAAVAAISWGIGWLGLAAGVLALGGLVLAYIGLFVGGGGGAGGAVQAGIEAFDLVIRLGANIVSFARLAAFGLTHAVLGWIVWSATAGLWGRGPAGMVAAVVVFVAGNAVTFALEALVASIQALRLEYYELFSRVFTREGRAFRPWHVPMEGVEESKEASCLPGSPQSRHSSLASLSP